MNKHAYIGPLFPVGTCETCGENAYSGAHLFNACHEPCDNENGPCVCGAWHKPSDFIGRTSVETSTEKQVNPRPFNREELTGLGNRCELMASIRGLNPAWRRAYLNLADAVDHLDAIFARSTVYVGPATADQETIEKMESRGIR